MSADAASAAGAFWTPDKKLLHEESRGIPRILAPEVLEALRARDSINVVGVTRLAQIFIFYFIVPMIHALWSSGFLWTSSGRSDKKGPVPRFGRGGRSFYFYRTYDLCPMTP